jgi:hypothetical protein
MLQGHIGDEAMRLARLATRETGESTHSMPARPPELNLCICLETAVVLFRSLAQPCVNSHQFR